MKSSFEDDEYLHWKRWDSANFGNLPDDGRRIFSTEIGRAGRAFDVGTRVLEIGFGNGEFLAYAHGQGWHAIGVEANQNLVKRALSAGFEAYCDPSLTQLAGEKFDLIVAFDVLEHIESSWLITFMGQLRRLLNEGGCLIARFPNGDSPFGLKNQNGDLTHITMLGSGKAHALAALAGLQVTYLGASAQTYGAPTIASFVHHHVARITRAVVDRLVSEIFFARESVAFSSPNLTMVCKPSAGSASQV